MDTKTRGMMHKVATVRMLRENMRIDFTVDTAMLWQKNGYLRILGDATRGAIVNNKAKHVPVMDAFTFGSDHVKAAR